MIAEAGGACFEGLMVIKCQYSENFLKIFLFQAYWQ
jgi:hypothetical protein